MIAALLLLGAITFSGYRVTSALRPALEEIDRIRSVEVAAAWLLSDFRESQSERRAYLVSGDRYFLARYVASFDSARRRLAVLDSITSGDQQQHRLVREAAALLNRADSLGDETIRARETVGVSAAAALVRSRSGQQVGEALETLLTTLSAVERERHDAALALAQSRAARAQLIAIGSAALALILLPSAAIVIWKDLHERRQTARELRQMSLEAKTAARTKSEFLASMSHEIRTPLNGIIGMTELALDTELTPLQRDYLRTAHSSAELLLRLLNDILDFSKIDAGRLELESTTFSLREVCGEALRGLAVRAQQKGLELSLRVIPTVPDALIGDPARLQQILLNLVGNAIKFTQKGEVAVTVESERVGARATRLHVVVRDTGIGIPEDRINVIFDLFSQADSSTTRRFGGSGLGLTISERLVKLMGGEIWVESRVGAGSTFHFTAELAVAEQEHVAAAPLEVIEGMRVLVVDDSATGRLIVEEMLSSWGMRSLAASSGSEAIRLAQEARDSGRPVLVGIIDNTVGDTDGYSIAEQLAAAGVLPGTSVIVLSSENQPGGAARRKALGVTALMKPVKQSEFLNAILVAAVGRSSAAASAPHAPSVRLPRWPKSRVLVVEDNEVNQRVAAGLLSKRGIEVTLANNGVEALARLQADSRPFDLVLMDVEMPEMDGLEATRQFRAWEAQRSATDRLPIVAVTAHALAEEMRKCEAAGMDLCLTKPLRAVMLDDVLKSFLGEPASDDQRPAVPSSALEELKLELLTIVGGDSDLLASVVTEYRRQTPLLLAELEAAIRRGDAPAVRHLAHRIKGSSAQVAGDSVARAAAKIEDAARQGDLSQAPAAFRQLEDECDAFATALTALVAAHS